MPDDSFDLTIHFKPGMALLIFTGAFTSRAEQAVNLACERLKQEPRGHLLMDFKQVHFMNSHGVALLVHLLTEARKVGCHIKAFDLEPHLEYILRITRLTDYIEIFPDEAAAVAMIQVDRNDQKLG
jgi:anti-sigma B factor antagonist